MLDGDKSIHYDETFFNTKGEVEELKMIIFSLLDIDDLFKLVETNKEFQSLLIPHLCKTFSLSLIYIPISTIHNSKYQLEIVKNSGIKIILSSHIIKDVMSKIEFNYQIIKSDNDLTNTLVDLENKHINFKVWDFPLTISVYNIPNNTEMNNNSLTKVFDLSTVHKINLNSICTFPFDLTKISYIIDKKEIEKECEKIWTI